MHAIQFNEMKLVFISQIERKIREDRGKTLDKSKESLESIPHMCGTYRLSNYKLIEKSAIHC